MEIIFSDLWDWHRSKKTANVHHSSSCAEGNIRYTRLPGVSCGKSHESPALVVKSHAILGIWLSESHERLYTQWHWLGVQNIWGWVWIIPMGGFPSIKFQSRFISNNTTFPFILQPSSTGRWLLTTCAPIVSFSFLHPDIGEERRSLIYFHINFPTSTIHNPISDMELLLLLRMSTKTTTRILRWGRKGVV